jgi:hypothetical protein
MTTVLLDVHAFFNTTVAGRSNAGELPEWMAPSVLYVGY